ncbi:MAG TPA: hypothetical protein VFV31_02620 [Chitinophagaceae bacterium]|nr:hypothetical protein [Chitinophagaceae bacterium]
MQNQLEARLEKLEKQFGKSRKLNVILIAGILLSVLYGFKEKQALEDLKVKSITIADDYGKVYATIGGSSSSGGWLNLFDKSGNHTVWLTQMKEGGGYVGVKNLYGREVAAIGTQSDGDGYMDISDNNGYTRCWSGVDKNGGCSFTYNTSGYNTIYLGNGDRGYGGLVVYDNNHNTQAYVGGNNYGNGEIDLYNDYGRRVIFLGGGDYDKKGYLYTYDGYNTTGYFPR